jgi:hypothetical protein
MSSATLTDTDRRSRRAALRARAAVPPPPPPASTDSTGLRPWHFFLLATLSLATVAVVLMRHETAPAIALVALTVCAAGYAAYALYRTLNPLAGGELDDDAAMLGGRTRAALERDKGLVLRAIKELEFDHAMGKVADGDFAEIRDRLRVRALRLMRQLDGAEAYRQAIERDLASRVPAAPPAAAARDADADAPPTAGQFCTQCGAAADADARFCRMCGRSLQPATEVRS